MFYIFGFVFAVSLVSLVVFVTLGIFESTEDDEAFFGLSILSSILLVVSYQVILNDLSVESKEILLYTVVMASLYMLLLPIISKIKNTLK